MNNLMSEQINEIAPALRKAKKVFLPVVKSKHMVINTQTLQPAWRLLKKPYMITVYPLHRA